MQGVEISKQLYAVSDQSEIRNNPDYEGYFGWIKYIFNIIVVYLSNLWDSASASPMPERVHQISRGNSLTSINFSQDMNEEDAIQAVAQETTNSFEDLTDRLDLDQIRDKFTQTWDRFSRLEGRVDKITIARNDVRRKDEVESAQLVISAIAGNQDIVLYNNQIKPSFETLTLKHNILLFLSEQPGLRLERIKSALSLQEEDQEKLQNIDAVVNYIFENVPPKKGVVQLEKHLIPGTRGEERVTLVADALIFEQNTQELKNLFDHYRGISILSCKGSDEQGPAAITFEIK